MSVKEIKYKQLKNKGIEIQMDGSALPDQIVYTPGDHTYTVIAGKEIYSKKIGVSYSVKDTLIKKDGKWLAYNTDAEGFLKALLEFLNLKNLKHKKISIIGAGGAAKAVAYAVYNSGGKACIFNRTL